MKNKSTFQQIFVGVIVGAIIGIGGTFFAMTLKQAKLESDIEYLKKQIEKFEREQPTEKKEAVTPSESEQLTTKKEDVSKIEIPLTAGWKPQGPGSIGGGYREGNLVLRTNLQSSDDYAELFLDLRAVHLPGIDRNPDGTYNLSGKEIIAMVRSEYDFKGNPSRPNGAQFLLKDKDWNNLVGTWLNITDAMITEQGMEVFYKIPNDIIARQVAGISLKFTVGTGSRASYDGSFFVRSIRINK